MNKRCKIISNNRKVSPIAFRVYIYYTKHEVKTIVMTVQVLQQEVTAFSENQRMKSNS